MEMSFYSICEHVINGGKNQHKTVKHKNRSSEYDKHIMWIKSSSRGRTDQNINVIQDIIT